MSITQSIYNFIRACPLIEKGIRVRFNRLGDLAQEFSVEDTPEDVIVQRFIGSSIRQKTFYLTSRESYSQDQRVNIEKSDFYEAFQEWIEEQNRIKNFPVLGGNKRSVKLECLTSGYLYAAEEDTAQYQIQLRLQYENKGER